MTFNAAQQPCARRSRAARLSGLRDCFSPLGKTNMCPAGSKIEAASEATTSKSKSSVIGTLILKTADDDAPMFSTVNDYSYQSVSGEWLVAEISKRKGLLSPAARRWDQGPSRGHDASGRNDRVLSEMVS